MIRLFTSGPATWSILEWLVVLSVVTFYLHFIYQNVIGLRGFGLEPPLPRVRPSMRFAVLIPAHNEERVIGFLVDNLLASDYPRVLFDVYVSCDSCTDRTAAVVTEHGGLALVREDPTWRSKPANIRWALEQIELDRYDSVAMIDADNLVESDFLARMNDYFAAHPEAEAVQGYADSKNPGDTWVTRAYALAYWFTNRFFQLARRRWGLSAQLAGTGSVFSVACLRRMGWDLVSLTDDLEFSTRLILAGGVVHWNELAIIYDEKPLTLRASGRQRLRWMQGHYWCCWRYGPTALARFFRTGRIQYLDLVLYLIAPGRTALSYLLMFGGLVVPTVRTIVDPGWLATEPLSLAWIGWPIYAVVQSAYRVVIGPSYRLRRVTLRYVPSLFAYWWWGLTWMPYVVFGAVLAPNQRVWNKTTHTRGLALSDVSGGSDTATR